MLGVAVVACDADGLLVPVQHAAQLVSKDLHQERLHHATSVAENVSTKRVNDFTAVRPSYRAMNGRFTDTISAVIDQRFPLDLSARWYASLLPPSGLTGYILLPGRLPATEDGPLSFVICLLPDLRRPPRWRSPIMKRAEDHPSWGKPSLKRASKAAAARSP